MLTSSLSRNFQAYLDEDTSFHRDPCQFLEDHFPKGIDSEMSREETMPSHETSRYTWPSHLAVFQFILSTQCNHTDQTFGQILYDHGYLEEKRFWNTFWHEDSRRAGDVVVFKRSMDLVRGE